MTSFSFVISSTVDLVDFDVFRGRHPNFLAKYEPADPTPRRIVSYSLTFCELESDVDHLSSILGVASRLGLEPLEDEVWG